MPLGREQANLKQISELARHHRRAFGVCQSRQIEDDICKSQLGAREGVGGHSLHVGPPPAFLRRSLISLVIVEQTSSDCIGKDEPKLYLSR